MAFGSVIPASEAVADACTRVDDAITVKAIARARASKTIVGSVYFLADQFL
jgi:hypothetical protein